MATPNRRKYSQDQVDNSKGWVNFINAAQRDGREHFRKNTMTGLKRMYQNRLRNQERRKGS